MQRLAQFRQPITLPPGRKWSRGEDSFAGWRSDAMAVFFSKIRLLSVQVSYQSSGAFTIFNSKDLAAVAGNLLCWHANCVHTFGT